MENRGRFSSTWIQQFDTCLKIIPDPDTEEPMPDPLPQILSLQHMCVVLCAIAEDDFEVTTVKLSLLQHLSTVLAANPENAQPFLAAGGIPIMVRAMTVNPQHTQVQAHACCMMEATAKEGEIAQIAFAQADATFALLDALPLLHTECAAQLSAIAALHVQAVYPASLRIMQEEHSLNALLLAMHGMLPRADCIALMARTLSVVVLQAPDVCAAAGKAGVISDLVQALELHHGVADVVTSCMLTLIHLTAHCQCNVEHFKAVDGVKTLFVVLAGHPGNLWPVQKALTLLEGVLKRDEEEMRKTIMDPERIDQLCNMCHLFSTNLDVLPHLIDVFISMCEHDLESGRLGVTMISEKLFESEALCKILKGMRLAFNARNGKFLGRMCKFRKLISLSSELRMSKSVKLLECACCGIEIAVESLQVFLDQKDVITNVIGLISSLVSGNDKLKVKFIDLGGVSAVLEVMKHYKRDERMNVECCRVVDYAAEGQLMSAPTLLKGKDIAMLVIVSTMANLSHCAALQESACSLLIKVAAISAEEAEKLVKIGARNLVQMAQMKHAGNPGIESLANQLLILLVDPNSQNARGGPNGPRGTAGSRARSRSRTRLSTEGSEAARARAEKSRSPVRVNKARRPSRERRMAAAKASTGGGTGHIVGSRVRVRRAARQKMDLEPIFE